jgi:hypothetical protein
MLKTECSGDGDNFAYKELSRRLFALRRHKQSQPLESVDFCVSEDL